MFCLGIILNTYAFDLNRVYFFIYSDVRPPPVSILKEQKMDHEQIKMVFRESCPKGIDFVALKLIKTRAKLCSVKNSFPHSISL